MAQSKAKAAAFGEVFQEAIRVAGGTDIAFAQRLGISQKTLIRWKYEGSLPPVRTRIALLHELRDLPPELLGRLADSLEVGHEHLLGKAESLAARAARTAPSIATAHALQTALLGAMEHLPNESAKRVREAVALVVRAIADLGLDAATAHAMLRAPAPARTEGAVASSETRAKGERRP